MKYYLLGFLLVVSLGYSQDIYIVPFPGMEQALFKPARDDCTQLYIDLKTALAQLGKSLKVITPSSKISQESFIIVLNPLFQGHHILSLFRKKNRLLIIKEPPVVSTKVYEKDRHEMYGTVLTMLDSLVDDKKYFRIYQTMPTLKMVPLVDFYQKKFGCFIGNNKASSHPQELYSAREKLFSYFSNFHGNELDVYGSGWKGLPLYKGSVPHKCPVISNYKYCFAYENAHDIPGYITEKIFDTMLAGCVPIYWGANNITDFVPVDCLIDRRLFSNYDELYTFLKNITEEEYNQYIKNIRNFFESDHAFIYSIEFFIDTILTCIEPGYQKNLLFNEYTIDKLMRVKQLSFYKGK